MINLKIFFLWLFKPKKKTNIEEKTNLTRKKISDTIFFEKKKKIRNEFFVFGVNAVIRKLKNFYVLQIKINEINYVTKVLFFFSDFLW